MSSDIYKTNPAALARIMDLEGGPSADWREDELAAMLVHQLSAPIDPAPRGGAAVGATTGAAAGGAAGQTPPTRFGELFHHPQPPLELLESTKNLAKSAQVQADESLQQIATVLYYSSILAALLRCGRRITRLDDTALKAGVQWVLDQPWVDESTRGLFREGLASLSGGVA